MDGLCLNMTIFPFCENFGLATVAIQVQDILNYTSIDPMVQRKLSGGQRRKIANYLQERDLDRVFLVLSPCRCVRLARWLRRIMGYTCVLVPN